MKIVGWWLATSVFLGAAGLDRVTGFGTAPASLAAW
jgi:hypothetical protein